MANVALISTYEMGRQPFGIASPAAWLRAAGAEVSVQDLAVSDFDPEPVRRADLVALYVPMHTATRLAEQVLDRVRRLNPDVHVCCYGLYAPMNEQHLRRRGADTILGGEFEQSLVDLYHSVVDNGRGTTVQLLPTISLRRQEFLVPDRSGLPSLDRYSRLEFTDGVSRIAGYTEASRGCRHLCRHCPVVPVYQGKFVVVAPEVVLKDVRRQVAAGAEHITFGDPDFFNGPAHAMRIVKQLHREFGDLTYDVTIKVEHLARQSRLIPVLKDTGCALVTSAIESFDDDILARFDKRHTRNDFDGVLAALRAADLPLNATFVAFTPWTTLRAYVDFLHTVAALDLVDNIASIQYAIRLLVVAGSRLLELPDVADLVGEFDERALMYPWAHPDPAVDDLQRELLATVERGSVGGPWAPRDLFGCLGSSPRRVRSGQAAGARRRRRVGNDSLLHRAVVLLSGANRRAVRSRLDHTRRVDHYRNDRDHRLTGAGAGGPHVEPPTMNRITVPLGQRDNSSCS